MDAARIFADAGYAEIEACAHMPRNTRTFLIGNIVKKTNRVNNIRDARLVLEIIDVFQTKMRNAEDHKVEAVHIPNKMRTWAPKPNGLAGPPTPDQEMINRSAIEITRESKRPRHIPLF